MEKICLFLLLMFHMSIYAQDRSDSNGINFEQATTWTRLIAKAKEENKMIFVDFAASWCVPCKEMEKNIFPLSVVGSFFNEKFVSIKLQEDIKKSDSDFSNQRLLIDFILNNYKISAYPTFLFFNSEGMLLHRKTGGLSVDEFIQAGKDAINPINSYFSQIKLFQNGGHENLDLYSLAINAKYAGDEKLSKDIAMSYLKNISDSEMLSDKTRMFFVTIGGIDKVWRQNATKDYVLRLKSKERAVPEVISFLKFVAMNETEARAATDDWLTKLPDNELFSDQNIRFLETVIGSSLEKSFHVLFYNKKKVEKVTGVKNFAQETLDDIIFREEFIEPVVASASRMLKGEKNRIISEPDWKDVQNRISKRFDRRTAKRLKHRCKMAWYSLVKDKSGYIENLVLEMDRTNGFGFNSFYLNNSAMEIFRYSKKKHELKRAIYWMSSLFKTKPQEFKGPEYDTYANLLYKLGKVKEAIHWQEKALVFSPRDSEIKENLLKMMRGEPTWQN